MPETEEEKKVRLEAEAKQRGEEKRLAIEAEEKKKRETPQQHNPHASSADMTRELMDEWTEYKTETKWVPKAKRAASNGTPASTPAHNAEECPFGELCPFPSEPH